MLGTPTGAHVLGLAKDIGAGESKSEISFQFFSASPHQSEFAAIVLPSGIIIHHL